MNIKSTRRGFTQNNWVGQALPDKAPAKGHLAAFSVPLVGKMPWKSKRGFLNKETPFTTPLPACGVLPPQGGQMTARGFTLIELLVVVLIIGILAAVAVPQYQKAVEKSRTSEAITMIKSFADAEKVFHLSNGEYTTNFSNLDIGVEVDGSVYTTNDWSFALRTDQAVPRMSATRLAYDKNKGQYHIGYDFTKNMFFCSTNAGDTRGSVFCSAFGTAVACNHSEGDPCVYF